MQRRRGGRGDDGRRSWCASGGGCRRDGTSGGVPVTSGEPPRFGRLPLPGRELARPRRALRRPLAVGDHLVVELALRLRLALGLRASALASLPAPVAERIEESHPAAI